MPETLKASKNKSEKPKILIASKNKNKITELSQLLEPIAEVLSLSVWEKENKPLVEPLENGETFFKNALIKANFYTQQTGLTVLSDDSGLSVWALNNKPGVHSARYGPKNATDKEKYEYLLKEINGQHNREAYFTSVLVLAKKNGYFLTWEAEVHGLISRKSFGENGFGYDPVFYYPPLKKTFAQLSFSEKNIVSHRALAGQKLKEDFKKIQFFLK